MSHYLEGQRVRDVGACLFIQCCMKFVTANALDSWSRGRLKCKVWYLHFDCFSRWTVKLLLLRISWRDPEISAIWFYQSAGGRAWGKCKYWTFPFKAVFLLCSIAASSKFFSLLASVILTKRRGSWLGCALHWRKCALGARKPILHGCVRSKFWSMRSLRNKSECFFFLGVFKLVGVYK